MVSLTLIFSLLFVFAPVLFGPDGRFHLQHAKDSFGMRSHGIIEATAPNRTKFYPLPQSTAEQFIKLRAEDLHREFPPVSPGHYDREEVIGPWQLEGSKLWFGNNFYDSEGSRGVGAFGYFDTETRSYTLFSPPEVARYETSAILVEPDSVWLGLDQFIEDISKWPGGLVQWNRTTRETKRYPLEFNIEAITREGSSLRLKTRNGYALLKDGEFHRFLPSGREIAKFPAPPTHY